MLSRRCFFCSRLACFALAMFAVSPLLLAQAQGGKNLPLPTAEQVLAKYEAFLGGSVALSRIVTRTVRMRRIIVGSNPSDYFELRYSKRPMFAIMRHEALDGTFVQWTNGCEGTSSWMGYGKGYAKDSGAPVAGTLAADGVCEQEQYYYGYLPLDMTRFKSNVQGFEVRGMTTIVPAEAGPAGKLAGSRGRDLVPAGPRQVYLVLSVPSRNTEPYVWLYFDAETGALLRRADAGRGSPAFPGENPRFTDFIQYRDAGNGTRAPFQAVTTFPNTEIRIIHLSVINNEQIPDDVFLRPKDVRREDKGL